jgi:phosphatidylserine/phosphatidylglycerophosphate/cardiolipin synthase-like enzyme
VVGYDEVENKILELLYKAKKRIYLSIFAFTNEKIFTLLKYKESKGLDIKIITDSWFLNSKLNNYPVRNLKIIEKPMLHHKFMIVDDKLVLGSANFTLNGLNKNFEIVYITEEYLENYLEIFNFLWRY